MEIIIKNIERGFPVSLIGEVSYLPGQIVSKTLCQNPHHSLTLFAFDRGEEISAHESNGDAMVLVLDGQGKITIDGTAHFLSAGECIVMPSQTPHAVFAEERFKMLLIVFFPEEVEK